MPYQHILYEVADGTLAVVAVDAQALGELVVIGQAGAALTGG